MQGRIARTLWTAGAAGLVLSWSGCCHYWNKVDPSYPERYEFEAREIIDNTENAQVLNGHILDQTIWNIDFEPGTDRLSPSGMRRLAALARARPAPDPTLYLQTAYDILIDPGHPEEAFQLRSKLDVARKIAIERYTGAMTCGSVVFQVVIPHDPSQPSLFGQEACSIIQDIRSTARGTMSVSAGSSTSTTTTSSSGGGSSGGSSSSGGGSSAGH